MAGLPVLDHYMLSQTLYSYSDHANLVRYQGRPVVFFWQAPSRGNDWWSCLRGQLDPDHNVLLELHLSGCANFDDRYTTTALGQTLLKLLAVVI